MSNSCKQASTGNISHRDLNKAQGELELLAAIATLEHFQFYVDGQKVTLQTDHNNLRWIMNIKNPQGKLARWITRLSSFDVEFVYR